MRAAVIALFLLCFTLQPAAATAAQQEFTGRIVAVTDGDTVKLLTPEHEQIRIRLAEIDAPEKRQPYGAKAKAELSGLCFGKTVRAAYVNTDRYGRTVAHLYVENLDINADMIRRGAAWAYRKYLHDPSLLALEAQARNAGRGLWSLPPDQRIPPWDWRQQHRKRHP
jgi:micrococcal nuclease